MFKYRSCASACAFAAIAAWVSAIPAFAANPSLCLSPPSGCDEPGSTVNVEVLLGAGDPTIVGVQFELQYDPEALTAFEVLPGASCDPTSPFTLEIHQQFHDDTGRLFYAVGIDFANGTGTNQAATVACIRFLPRGVSTSSIDILVGDGVEVTRISDDTGHSIPINNSQDCPGGPPGVLATVNAFVKDVCRCTTDADCETLTSDCREGLCDPLTSLCGVSPHNEGGVCDDRNDCTSNDRCAAGVCAGSGCTNPSICFGGSCARPGQLGVVPILLGEGVPVISGGQFSLQWDATGLDFVDVQPGVSCDPSSPFTFEVRREGNPEEGELFYAVGVTPGAEGTTGPATMACLYFNVLDRSAADICLFEDINPHLTKLVDENGQLVSFYNEGDCGSELGYPILQCEVVGFCDIPTASEWGLVVMGLLLLVGAKLRFRTSASV